MKVTAGHAKGESIIPCIFPPATRVRQNRRRRAETRPAPAPPAIRIIFHAGKIVLHAGKIIFHARKIVFHAGKIISPAGNIIPHAGKTVSPAGKVILRAGTIVSPGDEMVLGGGKIALHDRKVAWSIEALSPVPPPPGALRRKTAPLIALHVVRAAAPPE